MFDRWLKLPAHHYLFLTGILLIIVGLPLNKVVLSTGSIWVVANWILEGQFHRKWTIIKSAKVLYPLYIFIVLHFAGLLFADDFQYALHDLKIKLPFLSLPIVLMTSKQLQKKTYFFFLSFYIGILLLTTGINFLFFYAWGPAESAGDIRSMSIFISHIRLAWMIVFAIAIGAYFIFKNWGNRWLHAIIIAWFLLYIYQSQSLTGFAFLGILLLTSLLYILFNQRRIWLRWTVIGINVIFFIYVGYEIASIIKEENNVVSMKLEDLDTHSANGSRYFNDVDIQSYENGYRVFVYYAEEEMKQAWNQRSDFNANGKDKKGNILKYTLARYLTSKGLRKDSIGVYTLSEEDIHHIENGMPNYRYAHQGIFFRLAHVINATFFESNRIIDPNGNSILQRKEHYRAALEILENNFWLGVGTGGVPAAYEKAYREIETKLKPEYRHRVHNQYLTFWITFGVLGFVLFIIWVLTPLAYAIKYNSYLPIVFFVMLLFIAMTEDVLETHVGVSYVSFFYGFLLARVKT